MSSSSIAGHRTTRSARKLSALTTVLAALIALEAPTYAQPAAARAAPAPKLTKPPRVVKFVEAEHPKDEDRAASVVLSVTISATGTVDEAKVTESAGPAFDAAAVAAVKQFVFEPAEIDGKPAPIKILYRYEFTLKVEAPTTAIFDGVVHDRGTNKPLANVEISVEGGGRATTDADGKFHIEGVAPGKHAISLAGEKLTTLRTEETFEAGKRLEASYDVVIPSAAAPEGDQDDLELVVTAPALDKKVVATAVSAEEGRRLPGTQGDVLKVVESMPGVARSQVGSGQLVVWGAAPEDTRVYVDGVRVPRLYHGGGVRSIVATDLVDSVELAPGGWGAAWGRGLGGLVTVRTRRADETRFRASASVDVIDAGATVRTPITKDVRIAVAARRSHLHSTIAPFADDSTEDLFPIPRYEDAQARVAWQLGSNERIDVTGLHSNDRITRSAPSIDPTLDRRESRRVSFQRIYARYERDTSGKHGTSSISAVPWFGFDRSSLTQRFGGVPTELASQSTVGGLRASWRGRVSPALSIATGIDAEISDVELRRSGSVTSPAREGDARVFGQIPGDRLNADRWTVTNVGLAPYAELDAAPFGDVLHIVPGVRFDPYFSAVSRKTPVEGDTPSVGSFRQDAAIEPRLAVRWQPATRLGLRAAYGRYHQQAAPEDLSAVFGNPLLPAAAAHHFVGGQSVRIFEKTSLETTAFYVVQEDLAMRSTLSSPLLAEALVPIGAGRSYGAQTLLRQELAHGLTGWVSYTLARSLRRDAPDRDYRLSDYDQSHVITAVGSYALGKGFEVGARVRASTGFPRTPVIGAIYDARRDVSEPMLGPKNTDRIPAFFQLDVRGSKRWNTQAGEFEAYLEVQNVTNRQNPEEIVYSNTYAKKDYLTGLPILPIVGLRWSL
ncbi:MAG TPA: TonB-dependent receptor [Labilithrix sp.]|nr:TonB-dependent receptor [Labilithrix sp.]